MVQNQGELEMSETSRVDRHASESFQAALASLTTAMERIVTDRSDETRRSRSIPDRYEEAMLLSIVDTVRVFEEVANLYQAGAIETIQLVRKKTGPFEDSYYYNRFRTQLAAHIELLMTLLRNHVRPSEIRMIDLMIAGISHRFQTLKWLQPEDQTEPVASPTLISWPMPGFAYVDLLYVTNFGIIGIPYESWLNPGRELSVLWHEVGGYAIAVARRSGHLHEWAKELAATLGQADDVKKDSKAWKHYLSAYLDAVMDDLPYEPILIEGAKSDAIRIKNSQKLRYYLGAKVPSSLDTRGLKQARTDIDWQADWLGEFFEDMFGAQALGSQMLTVLADVLVSATNGPNHGDSSHPGLTLRLQTIIEFLHLLLHNDVTLPHFDEENLVFSALTANKLKDAIGTIQELYTHRPDIQALCLPNFEPESMDQEIGQFIAQMYIDKAGVLSDKKDSQNLSEAEKQAIRIYFSVLEKNTNYDKLDKSYLLESGIPIVRSQRFIDELTSIFGEQRSQDLTKLSRTELIAYLNGLGPILAFTDTDWTPVNKTESDDSIDVITPQKTGNGIIIKP